MAHIEPMGLDALTKMENALKYLTTDVDKVAQKCIDKASPTGERAYIAALKGTTLPASVSASVDTMDAKKNVWGDFAVSRPLGNAPARKNGKPGPRNAMLAAIWNYGTKKSDRVPATHWHSKAVAAATVPVTQIVEKTFNKEIKRLMK